MSDAIVVLLLIAGGFFCLVAGIGVVRLADVYARMHAATKAGTLGLALVCLARMVQAGTLLAAAEAFVVFFFLIASAPAGAHLIGRAAFRRHAPLDPRTVIEPGAEAFRQPPEGGPAAPPGPR